MMDKSLEKNQCNTAMSDNVKPYGFSLHGIKYNSVFFAIVNIGGIPEYRIIKWRHAYSCIVATLRDISIPINELQEGMDSPFIQSSLMFVGKFVL